MKKSFCVFWIIFLFVFVFHTPTALADAFLAPGSADGQVATWSTTTDRWVAKTLADAGIQPALPASSAAGTFLIGDGSGDWEDGGSDLTYTSSVFSVLSALSVDSSGTYPVTTIAGGAASGAVATALKVENTETGADGGGVAISLDGKDALDADVTFGTIKGSWLDESTGTKRVDFEEADSYRFDGNFTKATIDVETTGSPILKLESIATGEKSFEVSTRGNSAFDAVKFAVLSGWDTGIGTVLKLTHTGTGNTHYLNVEDNIYIDDDLQLGINTNSPDRKLDVLDDTNPQIRYTHTDGTVYGEIQVDSNGDTNFTTTGTQYTFDAPVKVNGDVVDTATDVETSTTTVSNTITKTAVFTSEIGTVNVGQIIKTEAWGTVTNDSAADDLIIDVDFNGTNLEQVDVAMGAVSGAHWHAKVDVIIRSTGATGTVAYHGDILLDETTYNFVGTATVDTTSGSVTTSVTWDAAKAGNTFLSLGAFREDKNRQ